MVIDFSFLRGPFRKIYYPKVLAAAGIIVLSFVVFIWLVVSKPEITPEPSREIINIVETATVELTDTRPTYRAYGTVQATRVADLRFAIDGEIESVSSQFRNGAMVEQGDVLAQVDTELLTIARNEIVEQRHAENINKEALETQFELRQRQFDRVSRMEAASVISTSSLDESTMALTEAENALNQSRSRAKQLDLAAKRAERNLREATLKAPFTGVISDVDIGKGKIVSNATRLGVITYLGNLEVAFVVPAEIYADAAAIKGAPVEIVWRSGNRVIRSSQGEIIRAEGSIATNEGGGRIYASVPDGANSIPPGSFVEVGVPSLLLGNVAVVPDTALFDNNIVYVIKDGRSSARIIEVLARSDGNIYIRGDIQNGDRIITTRIPSLGDGVLVKVIEQ